MALTLLHGVLAAEEISDDDCLTSVQSELRAPNDYMVQDRILAILDQATLSAKRQSIALLTSQTAMDPRPILRHLLTTADAQVERSVLIAFGPLGPASPEDHQAVAGCLTSAVGSLACQAAACLGVWNSLSDAPALIAQLESQNPDVASAALASLKAMSGQDHGLDKEAWTSWYQDRQQRDTIFQDLKQQLNSPRGATVVNAILGFSKFMSRKSELIELLQPELADANPSIHAAALGILNRLDAVRFPLDGVQAPAITHRPTPKVPSPSAASAWPPLIVSLLILAGIFVAARRIMRIAVVPPPLGNTQPKKRARVDKRTSLAPQTP